MKLIYDFIKLQDTYKNTRNINHANFTLQIPMHHKTAEQILLTL